VFYLFSFETLVLYSILNMLSKIGTSGSTSFHMQENIGHSEGWRAKNLPLTMTYHYPMLTSISIGFFRLEQESEAMRNMAEPRNAMDIRPGYRGRAFTSDLTGQEFWLVVDKGFQPMGLVIGNCIYSMGAVRNWLVGVKSTFQGELKEYSELMYQARELALSRMQFEADQLGADGVIGVDIKVEFMHNGEWMEVTAIGTAIRWVGSGPNMPPTGQGKVFIPAG
jgi:uncharacterized protein YbjQ (UPF0145 family)